MVGLEPFIASVPLLLYSMAAMTRQLREPTIRRGLGLGLLTVGLFYMHASSFLLLMVMACAFVAASIGQTWRDPATRAVAIRRALRATIATAPAKLTCN